jgi:predicted nucleic acid-binding protein
MVSENKQNRRYKQINFIGLWAPDQGSMVDFFLFPHLKSIMKCARFADVAAIQELVTAVLRSIPKEVFADSFHKLYERCQHCVVRDCDYFEGQ